MKLNITEEKLKRILVAANPVLANCKGSKKAVRLFLNMLGLKCQFTGDVQAIIKFSSNTLTYLNDSLFADYTSIESRDYPYIRYGSPGGLAIMLAGGDDFAGASLHCGQFYDSVNKTITVIMRPYTTAETESSVHSFRTNYNYDFQTKEQTIEAYEKSITDALRKESRISLVSKSFMYLPNADDFKLAITNVTDKDLQPVKSVLAKQLQEILPINMIVEAENIIGTASNE